MSAISAVTLIPGPSLTRTVDRLVDAALAYRTLDSYDRRRMMVRLSARGIARHRTRPGGDRRARGRVRPARACGAA